MPIRHHPDQAGLIGVVYLARSRFFDKYESILAVEIGGSKIRAGIVDLNLKKNRCFSPEKELMLLTGGPLSRYLASYTREPSRDEAIEHLAGMLHDLAKHATKKHIPFAPFVGVGCPGLIAEHGLILRGGQNLQVIGRARNSICHGRLTHRIRSLGNNQLLLVIHNDAVVQGT